MDWFLYDTDLSHERVNGHVGSIYDRNINVGKVTEVEESEAEITFYQNSGEITNTTVFCIPKQPEQIWMSFSYIICIFLNHKYLHIRIFA